MVMGRGGRAVQLSSSGHRLVKAVLNKACERGGRALGRRHAHAWARRQEILY